MLEPTTDLFVMTKKQCAPCKKKMAKTAWVIMKQGTCPAFLNIPVIHLIGFSSKREAMTECDRLNSKSFSLVYFIKKANVFQPQENN